MHEDIAEDLRSWLKEPFFSQEQRRPLALDKRQLDLAVTRTTTGYRRIKGAAGSGKSVVLAARAARLAAEGKCTLVVSYNITLLNYLRDLVKRCSTERPVFRASIDFLNFHSWCKRVCDLVENGKTYRGLWQPLVKSEQREGELQEVLNEKMPSLVQQLYRQCAGQAYIPKYDAILVDEGQDFHPSWWKTLRCALTEGGEMVLVADKTQNIYGTAAAWTEETMLNAGFHGPWVELTNSYRLSPVMTSLVRSFAEEFMKGEELDVPRGDQIELNLYPVELRWLHVRHQSNELGICESELLRMMKRLRPDTAIPDIIFLSSSKSLGRRLVKRMESKRVHVLHTFDVSGRKSRRQKCGFFQGAAMVKATTPHSFKGWEARHLVLYIQTVTSAEDKALLYTSLTRLRRHMHGSCLAVVSCCDELRSYGKLWPYYSEV